MTERWDGVSSHGGQHLAAEDQFRDRTMSFGEHLEELRIHLFRALYGVLAALFITAYFGNTVVAIIKDPVERRYEPWQRKRIETRAAAFKKAQQELAADKRTKVDLEATLSPDDLNKIAEKLGVTPPKPIEDGITLSVHAPIGNVVDAIAEPMADIDGKWSVKTFSVQEGFVIYFKAVLGASVLLASPWVFYQIYSFIAVGLYAHERRFVMLSLPFSVVLFVLGVLTCYFLAFPRMLDFFFVTNDWLDIESDIRLNEWVGFSVILMLIFGIGFQLPLFMLLLERVGIITHEWMASQRRMAILVLAIVAAVVTPGGDPITMLFLAIPLYFLFELGLFLMQYFRRNNPFAGRSEQLEEVEMEI